MASDFEDSIPFEVIDYYEGEAANVINSLIKYLYIRPEDFWYFDFDKEVVKDFVRFILTRIKESKNLNSKLRNYFLINRTKYPGEY